MGASRREPRLRSIRWDPSMELEVMRWWEEERIYEPNFKAERLFTIDTPPPTPRVGPGTSVQLRSTPR